MSEAKRSCHITQYIKKLNPELNEILDAACIGGFLRPQRGHVGLTFIYPTKATITKWQGMVDNDKLEEVTKEFRSHIAQYYIPTVASWEEFKSDIPNNLEQKMPVKIIKGVVHIGKAKISKDEKFIQFSPLDRPPNLSVWRIDSGDIEYDDSLEKSKSPFVKTRVDEKVQGGSHLGKRARSTKDFVAHVIEEYISSVYCTDDKVINPMFEYLVSLLRFVKGKHTEWYNKIIQHLTPLPISAFIFVFCKIPQNIFEDWHKNGRVPIDTPVTAWHEMFNAAPEIKETTPPVIDSTRVGFSNSLRSYYESLAKTRGGATGVELFGYNLAAYYEVMDVVRRELEIRATRGQGMVSHVHKDKFRECIYRIYETILDQKPIILSDSGRSLNIDLIHTIIHNFCVSDLLGWHFGPISQGTSEIKFRVNDGDKIQFVPYAVWHNMQYANESLDWPLVVQQIKAFGPERVKYLVEQLSKTENS